MQGQTTKREKEIPNPQIAPLMDQYKLYVEMADQNAARRQSANSFFFSLCAGLCAAMAFLFSKDADTTLQPLGWVIALAGVPICVFWHRLIESYRNLGTAKFKVIHSMESKLPFQPYTEEWISLGEGRDDSHYRPLTHLESWVPRCFGAGFLVLTLWAFPWRTLARGISDSFSRG